MISLDILSGNYDDIVVGNPASTEVINIYIKGYIDLEESSNESSDGEVFGVAEI